MKIGLQLFTLRKEANKDLYGTLKKISDTGIKYIECSYIPFTLDNAKIIAQAQKDFGIVVVALQVKSGILDNDFDNIMQFLETVACKTVNVSVMPPEFILSDEKGIIRLSQKINALASKYKQRGINFNYHHHDFEFTLNNGYKQFDTIFENFSTDVNFIIDTYWATKSGIFVPDLLRKMKDRVYGLHLRDYGLVRKFIDRKAKDFAVGDGLIDFDKVITTAIDTGVVYGAIEQRTQNPFDEITKSVKYLYKTGKGDLFL